MQTRLALIIFLFSIILFGCSANAQTAIENSQSDYGQGHACPRGVSDDPFPGRCGHYVDSDGNGYCDLGE